MKVRNAKAGRVLATGVLGIGMFGVAFASASTVAIVEAPTAQATGCTGGGGFTPFGGGSGVDCWTPAGNHVQCGKGGGGVGIFRGGGGGCRITWTNGTFTDCDITVVVSKVVVSRVNPCPFVP